MHQSGYTLNQIAEWIGGTVRGDGARLIQGVNSIEDASAAEITWLADPKYAEDLKKSAAGAVVAPEGFGDTPMPAILVAKPSTAIMTVLARFAPPVPKPAAGIHPTAVVAPSAQVAADACIGPHVFIGNEARIGARSVLHANVYVGDGSSLGDDCELWPGVVVRERCTLGHRVVVHPNTTIGADGFGYQFEGGRHQKIPQIGGVLIEDDVEIGANSCIDRAKIGVTHIGRGTKIDNLVQVAHNVRIGEHCILVAQAGIAGSTRLGRGVVLGGQVGLRDHIVLEDGVQVVACSCVSKDVPAKTIVAGHPAIEAREFWREKASIGKLPQLIKQVQELSARIERLEAPTDPR